MKGLIRVSGWTVAFALLSPAGLLAQPPAAGEQEAEPSPPAEALQLRPSTRIPAELRPGAAIDPSDVAAVRATQAAPPELVETEQTPQEDPVPEAASGNELVDEQIDEVGAEPRELHEEPFEEVEPADHEQSSDLVDAHEGAHAAHGEGPAAEHHEAGEHAEGDHGEHHDEVDWTEFLAMIVNFVLWLALVIFLLRKPLMTFLRERRREVVEGLAEAKRLKEEAESKYEEYSNRLERLDDELEKLRREMIQAGETERDRIIADAEEKAARMRRDAQFVIDQRMKQMRIDLTREAVEAAITAAETLLRDKTTSEDQKRMAEDYLKTLEGELRSGAAS